LQQLFFPPRSTNQSQEACRQVMDQLNSSAPIPSNFNVNFNIPTTEGLDDEQKKTLFNTGQRIFLLLAVCVSVFLLLRPSLLLFAQAVLVAVLFTILSEPGRWMKGIEESAVELVCLPIHLRNGTSAPNQIWSDLNHSFVTVSNRDSDMIEGFVKPFQSLFIVPMADYYLIPIIFVLAIVLSGMWTPSKSEKEEEDSDNDNESRVRKLTNYFQILFSVVIGIIAYAYFHQTHDDLVWCLLSGVAAATIAGFLSELLLQLPPILLTILLGYVWLMLQLASLGSCLIFCSKVVSFFQLQSSYAIFFGHLLHAIVFVDRSTFDLLMWFWIWLLTSSFFQFFPLGGEWLALEYLLTL